MLWIYQIKKILKITQIYDEKVIKYKGKIYLTKHHNIDKKKFEKMYKNTSFRKIVNQEDLKNLDLFKQKGYFEKTNINYWS